MRRLFLLFCLSWFGFRKEKQKKGFVFVLFFLKEGEVESKMVSLFVFLSLFFFFCFKIQKMILMFFFLKSHHLALERRF